MHAQNFLQQLIKNSTNPVQLFTQEDLDFIEEITAECSDVPFAPTPWLVPMAVKQIRWDQDEAVRLEHSYSFPWSTLLSSETQENLSAAMDDLVLDINRRPDGYMRHRDIYCMLSQAMNVMKKQAPAFRPKVIIPWHASKRTNVHLVIQRDRVVIDCHWLYSTESKVRAAEGAWRRIVKPTEPLQTARIEEFAATKISNDYRADSTLKLTEFQQAQMSAMQGKRIQGAFKELGALVADSTGARTASRFRKIERAIGEWCSRQPRLEKQYDKYRAYAVAAELLTSPSVPNIAQLAGFILGVPPLSESSARQTLKTLLGIVAKT